MAFTKIYKYQNSFYLKKRLMLNFSSWNKIEIKYSMQKAYTKSALKKYKIRCIVLINER